MGVGPYKFGRWETGRQIVLVRNDDYWNEARQGHLDRIIFRFISDNVASLQALKNGEVDFISRRISSEQFDGETNDPAFLRKFAKVEYYIGGFLWTGWNMRRPPFDDVRVRQAMDYGAFDRQRFLDEVLHGRGVIVTGYESYFGPAYNHDILPRPYDPEKAKELLLEAGWYDRDGDGLRDKNGQPFRFEFLMPSGDEAYRRRAALMKESLRKLGIDMLIRELEWATFIQNITDLKFDACTLRWATSIEGDPYQLWHTSQSSNRGSNYVGFGNAQSDRLIEQSRLEIDDTERRKLFFEFHRILHETQPYQFLFMEPELAAYDKKYRGVKFYKMRPGYDLTEWYIPKAS
jgi:peptide/nickel transport system substrate-binding protein